MQPNDDTSTAALSAAAGGLSVAWLATCQLLLVALLWGTTNPCLNRASKPAATASTRQQQQQQGDEPSASPAAPAPAPASPAIVSLLLNWRFMFPFVLNQLGSVLYLHCLGRLSLSFAVPTVNALTMLITGATARAMGERTRTNKRVAAGMALMLAGICLCILSQQQQQQAQQVEQENK